jgi:hypothetical protein
MIMIDKAGRIARIHVGYDEKNLEAFVAQINELLAQPAEGGPGVGETP